MNIETLTQPVDAARYRKLCFPRYQYLLEQSEFLENEVLALGYHFLGRAIALVVGEFCAAHQCVHVRSLFVLSSYRNQGIGGHVLAALAAGAKQRGYARLDLEYPINRETTPALEKLLAKQDWSAPEPDKIICKSEGMIDALVQAEWMNRYTFPETFSVFPWAELSEAEFQRIAAHYVQSSDEEGLAPQRDNFEPMNSLGLRYQGEVIGWMLTKRVAKYTILYENLFVQQAFRAFGRAASLLATSLKRHYACEGSHATGIWQSQLSNRPMVAFIKRRLGPYVSEWEETRRCYQSLS